MATTTTCDRCGVSSDNNYVIHSMAVDNVPFIDAFGSSFVENLDLCGSCRHKLMGAIRTWWKEKDNGNDSDV